MGVGLGGWAAPRLTSSRVAAALRLVTISSRKLVGSNFTFSSEGVKGEGAGWNVRECVRVSGEVGAWQVRKGNGQRCAVWSCVYLFVFLCMCVRRT